MTADNNCGKRHGSRRPATTRENCFSVDHATQGFEGLARQGITGLNVEGFLETTHGLAVHFFTQISAAQVVVRKMSRFVAAGLNGLLQPRNGLVKLAQFDQVGADVVIGIAKIGIEFNGAFAFGNGIEQFALKMIGPAEKCVGFGGRMKVQGRLVEFDSAIVVAFHLRLIGVLQHLPRASQGLLIHDAIVNGRIA